jgi:hypothetical protein
MVGVDAGVRTMMVAIGHGVTSCLCVIFGAWREHKKQGREQKRECILEVMPPCVRDLLILASGMRLRYC